MNPTVPKNPHIPDSYKRFGSVYLIALDPDALPMAPKEYWLKGEAYRDPVSGNIILQMHDRRDMTLAYEIEPDPRSKLRRRPKPPDPTPSS